MTLRGYLANVVTLFRECNEIQNKISEDKKSNFYSLKEDRKKLTEIMSKLFELEEKADKQNFLTFSFGELQKKFQSSDDLFPLKLEDVSFFSSGKNSSFATIKVTTKTGKTTTLNGKVFFGSKSCKSGKPITDYLESSENRFVLKEDKSFPGFSNFENLTITLTQDSMVNRSNKICKALFLILKDREKQHIRFM